MSASWVAAVCVLVAYVVAAVFAAGWYLGQAWQTRDRSHREVREIERRHFQETGMVLPRPEWPDVGRPQTW